MSRTGNLGKAILQLRAAARQEPKMRAYLTAQLIDDLGTAVSLWGGQLLMAKLFVDQATRASVMIPILVASFLGIALGGPLADWTHRAGPEAAEALAKWRWKLLVWGRSLETATLGLLIYYLAMKAPTAASLAPYFVVATFVRTGLISTRVALEVDLLREQKVQQDENGVTLLDERGAPRMFKVHLVLLVSTLSVLNASTTLGGLLLGNTIVSVVGGQTWQLFVADVLTSAAYVVILFFACHPTKVPGEVRLRDLGPEAARATRGVAGYVSNAFGQFRGSVVDAGQFLFRPEQRALLWFLVGGVILDATAQCFDDKMLMKQVVSLGDDDLRRAELLWSVLAIAFPLALPLLQRGVSRLGKLFVIALLVDGTAIVCVGNWSALGGVAPILPLVLGLGLDRGLHVTTKMLISIAQNSASGPAMRGRLSSAFLLAITSTNILVQLVATPVSERLGIPKMVSVAGLVQVLAVVALAVVAKDTLWGYGLRTVGGGPMSAPRHPS